MKTEEILIGMSAAMFWNRYGVPKLKEAIRLLDENIKLYEECLSMCEEHIGMLEVEKKKEVD